jgi:DDE family transposase
MPTSQLYDNTRARLATCLPQVRDSQLDTLALVVVGITQSVSAQLGKIARAMPLDTSQYAKEQRLRRLLDNERVSPEQHYQPIVKAALSGLKGQKVQLLIDRVLLQDRHNILVVSIGFRRRSIPLVWQALDHRGSSSMADQQALLKQALQLLPERVRVTVHGDSEFRSQELFGYLRALGHDVMLGVTGRTLVALYPGAEAVPLEMWLADRETVVYLQDVYLTEAGHGPVSVIAWWDRDDEGKLIVRAVMTNLKASWQTYCRGKRRMWIETVFRDWQSGGFHLDRTGITERERFVALLLPLVIAYLWLVSLGRWVVKKGFRRLIDDGESHSWHYSLFQLGVGWKERLSSYTQAIPVLLYIYT